jgi:hypothetical protein
MKGWISPVAFHAGLPCSGHGICIPPAVHSTQPCGSPPIPRSIVEKNFTCWWPPFPLIPINPLTVANALVLVHKMPIMLNFDMFIPHPSTCTNLVLYLCPCGKGVCVIPTPIPCSVLTIEDMGGVGHPRMVQATSLTVWALKRQVARVLDPLGFGMPFLSYPCRSVVAYGAPLVLSS